MSEEILKAFEYKIEATINFKDITYSFDELDEEQLEAAIAEMLSQELDFLNVPPSLGGFTVGVRAYDPVDVTDQIEAEAQAE